MPTLRDYQTAAIQRWDSVIAGGGTRASMILPTGTGKTVIASQLLPGTGNARSVFFVPTVVLLEQTYRQFATTHPWLRILRVCSPTARALDTDDNATEAQLAARRHIDATTDPDDILEHLTAAGPATVVATYASAPAVHAAALTGGTIFDLLICDEAHRTSGAPDKAWSLPVRDEFPARRRLFMTATARTITVPTTPAATATFDEIGWDTADIVSMDKLEIYGPHLTTLTFREAIDKGHLADYSLALIGITSSEANRTLARILAASPTDTDYTITDVAAHMALARVTTTHPHIHSILAFHNRIAASRNWTHRLEAMFREVNGDDGRVIEAVHIDGATEPEEQHKALKTLADPGDRLCVVSNCRVFAEGVDVPALDAVMFAAPRTSGPDIIQIIGRAIRPHPHGPNRKALIIVPVLLVGDADDNEADLAAARTSHLAAWRILTSLADQDELLHRSLLMWRDGDANNGGGPNSNPLQLSLPDGLTDVARQTFLRTIDRTIPSHLRTAAYLRDFYSIYGHTRTRPDTTFRTFPLGTAVRAAQAAYRIKTLPPRIVEEFDNIPTFAWTTGKAGPQRTVDDWIALLEHYVAKTGIRTIDRSAFVNDPDTGGPAKIGQWYHTKARRKNYLTPSEASRIDTLLTPASRGT